MPRKTKINSITSPELIAQINPENKEILSDFLNYLRSVKRSENTIAAYKNDIEIAFVWCLQNNHNKPFVNWTKRNIVAYQDWLLSTNENSPARVRRMKASLSSMSNYIENILDDEYPTFRNIINKIESPALQPVREKTVWEDDELEDILNKLIEKEEYQKACFLALAMYSGRRKSELCRFRLSDFDDDKLVCGGALYKSAPIKTKGRSGGKYIPCYTLAKRFRPYLEMWIEERNKLGIESEWLFPLGSDNTKHIGIATANSWTATFDKLTDKELYLHSLRHYFTTSLARAGIPDGVIQSIVAWESSDMVRLYTDIDTDEQIGMYFANGDISVPDKKSLADM